MHSPAIKQRADLVMRRNDGGGVAEFIDRFLLEDLGNVPRVFDRYQFEMGTRRSGSPVRLPVYGSNLLVLGSSGSGKSTLSGLMIERLTDQGYQVCAIDPEGDHAGLEPLVMVGSNHARPAAQEVTLALERNPAGAIVNLVSMNRADKVRLAADFLSAVFALRSALGRPRWLLIRRSAPSSADRGDARRRSPPRRGGRRRDGHPRAGPPGEKRARQRHAPRRDR